MCPNLTSPDNGSVEFSTRIGDRATYSCNPGMVLVGEKYRICQADGEWGGEEPVCGLSCPDLVDPLNGNVSQNGSEPGSMACYSCAQGYGPSSAGCRVCMLNGEWSGPEVTCESESEI